MGADAVDSLVRSVTETEVAAYREQGWVSLPGLVAPELAASLLTHLKQVTGLDFDSLSPGDPQVEEVRQLFRERSLYRVFSMSRLQDETVWEFASSRALGEAAAALTGRRPLRLLVDGVICKLPAWTDLGDPTASRRTTVWTGETPWHQDFSAVPWDRGGGVQFWLALSEITPEMGSMQHLTGSHREPPLGGAHLASDRSVPTLEQTNPELWEKYPLSEPHHFMPGDVLAHDPLTVHYAQPNLTDRLRWVYTSYRVPADTLYNGVPFPRFQEFGLEFAPWKPFEHPKFPIVVD